ncbi:MFS transporter [Brevibacillus reuszeri]|uniref:MFS transporter n=1 Tax=Brevibacillus reuszeri TaxID=54915 RepID=UPI000CCC648E|nr:MFS transporter [Brevibacillus reuszeri]
MDSNNVIQLFRNKNYLKLFFAEFTSQLGNVIGIMAITFYLLDKFSQQPYYTTLKDMMHALPALVVFLFIGVFADRLDRQKIAANCDLIRAFLTLCLMICIWYDSIGLIFLAIFIRSAVGKFFPPAQSAIIQGVLSKEEYPLAAGLNSMLGSIFLLFGSGLGAVVYWNLGVQGAFLLDFICLLISAMLIYSCKIELSVRKPNGSTNWKELLTFKILLKDFIDGVKYVVYDRVLLLLTLGSAILGVVNGGLGIIPIFIMKYKLSPNLYEEMSVIETIVFGIGILLGSALCAKVTKKIKLYMLLILSLILSGIFVIIAGLSSTIIIFLIFHFFFSVSVSFINISFYGWIPQIVNTNMMGRFRGILDPVSSLFQSLSLAFIAFTFPSIFSIEMLFIIIGGSLLLLGTLYILKIPSLVQRKEKVFEIQ